jgi:hypothetical protein
LIFFVLVLLFLMAKFRCPGQGCGREFKSGAALSAHKRACKDKISRTAKILLDKQQQERELENAQIGAKREEAQEVWVAGDDLDQMGQGCGLPPEVCVL